MYDVPLRVQLACPEPWVDRVTAALSCAGLVADPCAAIGLSISPGRQVGETVDRWSVESLPHLVVGVWPHAVEVGPWVVPGVGPCARCVAAATFDEGSAARPAPQVRAGRRSGRPEPEGRGRRVGATAPPPPKKYRNTSAMKTYRNGRNDMNLMHEELARAQMTARLGEAHELRRGHQLALARRMSRKAEKAAQQARLALARAI